MTAIATDFGAMPAIRSLGEFDRRSGNLLERLVFNNRAVMVVACAIVTLVLGYAAATRLVLNASFEKMIPQSQPYIQNYLAHQKELRGLGNAVRVVVENVDGDVFDPRYIDAVKQVSDELFLTPGVDRAWVKSLWSPNVRWTEVTEDGFRGGPVMPDAPRPRACAMSSRFSSASDVPMSPEARSMASMRARSASGSAGSTRFERIVTPRASGTMSAGASSKRVK